MLNIDQIEDQLNTIYSRRRTLNRAAAALNVARAVAHLREQFPTAAYAWVDVTDGYDTVGGQYSADILRVHAATGEVLWAAADEDSGEIESPATDALVYAARINERSIPHTGSTHPVAGLAPATDSGADPALLTFADVHTAAPEAGSPPPPRCPTGAPPCAQAPGRRRAPPRQPEPPHRTDPNTMRTIADFRRAAVAGSVWQCTNHLHPHVSGERRVTGGTSRIRYTGTKADGSEFGNGAMDTPRRADVRIEGDSITWLKPDGTDGYTWTLVRDEPADEGQAEAEHAIGRTGQPERGNPRFLIADAHPADDYAARGAVVVLDGRYIGHDTTGRVLFDRKDVEGAMTAAKDRNLRLIAYGYYGADVADADTPAPDIMRRRDAGNAAKAATPAAPVTVGEPAEIDAEKRARRVRSYAAKLSAETIRDENNPRPVDPTDDVLAKTFEHCGRPAPVDMYDEIRAAYAEFVAAWEDERYEAAKARYAALLNRPDVAAVAARLATLTDEERRHLDAAYRHHFRLYRSAQSELTHRCGRAYNERVSSKYGYRDVLHVAGQFAENAAEDYVKVLLWGDLLAENERPIFAGPWAAVIGEDSPRAALRERAEAYVSPWASV